MANKGAKELDAGKMKVKPGGSGKMHNFQGMGTQKPGVTGVSGSGGKSPGAKLQGGPSGKMHKFTGMKPQKAGKTSVT